MDTWRAWELVLPELERHHDVLALTFPGHAGGPPLEGPISDALLPDAIERAMDDAGFGTAHIVGNSLGGFVALQLAARGRVESVVALAPAGGWPKGDESFKELLSVQLQVQARVTASDARAGAIVASADGRRRATELVVTNFEHIPAELIAHQIVGVASCKGASALIAYAISRGTGSRRRGSPVRCGWCGARPTSCCRGRPPLHASEMTGSPPPTGSSWRALVTARSSMSRWRPHS